MDLYNVRGTSFPAFGIEALHSQINVFVLVADHMHENSGKCDSACCKWIHPKIAVTLLGHYNFPFSVTSKTSFS